MLRKGLLLAHAVGMVVGMVVAELVNGRKWRVRTVVGFVEIMNTAVNMFLMIMIWTVVSILMSINLMGGIYLMLRSQTYGLFNSNRMH